MPDHEVTRRYRFGAFEVDFGLGELRKAGLRIRLSGQPLQILEALLERPGELVTREELRARRWHADTFVDFEHNLNSAMKRLRAALGDGADVPRFIETLPRRGYRFLATVEIVTAAEPAPTGPPAATLPEPVLPPPPTPALPAAAARETPRWRRHLMVASLAAAVVLLAALASQWMRPPASDARSVVVLPFVAGNADEGSADDFVAFGMTDALIGELSRVSALKVISQTSAMQYKGVRKPLPQIARGLGVSTVVEGSVIHEGARVRITVQLIDARTDTHV